jgi:hypothetical protein
LTTIIPTRSDGAADVVEEEMEKLDVLELTKNK